MKHLMLWIALIAFGAFFLGVLFYSFYIVIFPKKENKTPGQEHKPKSQ